MLMDSHCARAQICVAAGAEADSCDRAGVCCRGVAASDIPSFDNSLCQCSAIDVLELASHRQTARDAAYFHAPRAQQLPDVMSSGLTFDGEVRGENGFAYDAIRRALHETIEVDIAGSDTIERRKRTHQHEIQSLVALRLLHHEEIGRRFDNT